jgi:pimeloyl-ACP methyl ester carboxylesterase
MPTLIFIPGLLCNQALWSSQIADLSEYTEFTVADITRQPTVADMAASILDTAPERFSLAGFSLGSHVALEIMCTARDRVERLALLSATHGGVLPPVEKALRAAITSLEEGEFDHYLEAAYPTYVAPHRTEDTQLKQTFLDMAHAVGAEAGIRQMRALLEIKHPFANLDQIRCPTVIIGGREDHRTTPAAHEALTQDIPGSTLTFIDNAAHFTPIEQPAAVTALLRHWLTS